MAFRDRKVCTDLASILHCLGEGAVIRERLGWRISLTFLSSHPRPILGQGQGLGREGVDPTAFESSRPWFIETAWEEFEEMCRKG